MMRTKTLYLLRGLAVWFSFALALHAEPPLTPVTPQDFYPLSRLAEAQKVAQAEGKPIGFLLTWPVFFPGAPGFLKSGSACATYFYQAFKDQAVLVNVDHSTGELDRLPKVAAAAFHSPAEGGYAPCLCLTDATFTRLIGMLPLWKNPIERREMFDQYQAVIADKSRWGEPAAPGPAAEELTAPLPTVAAAPPPRPAATPSRPSSDFKREMELTLAAERQQQKKASPSPAP